MMRSMAGGNKRGRAVRSHSKGEMEKKSVHTLVMRAMDGQSVGTLE